MERRVVPREYTITVGTYKDADELRQALQDGGCDMSRVEDILPEVVASPEPIELDLAVRTVEELGLGERADRKIIYDRARELGLDVCPPETGPQLWLQRQDQIDEMQLFIGMEPLTGSSGDVQVFQVGRYGPDVFIGTWAGEDIFYGGQSWAFVSRRSPTA
jgi:hypothetical protein